MKKSWFRKYVHIGFLGVLIFGALGESYANDLRRVELDKGIAENAIGSDLVKAWESLYVRNVQDLLRRNTNFLSRLSDNPNLVNYIDNLTPTGKTDLANNVDEWIKLYDSRPHLKSSNWDDAIELFNGNRVSSYVDPSTGYKFVIGGGTDPFPGYISKATQVINSDDVSIVAQNFANAVNLPNQTSNFENILSVCKEHMFMKSHLV